MNDIKAICFLLPQFHPIAENDAWWGKGFTEWTNVTKSQKLFRSHYQPHLPADLGFYDLRLPEARIEQATLAKQWGIHGFCYYHYWFGSRRLLEKPFNSVLDSGQPDFPFCLCWANESWSRRWLGDNRDVLIEQNYSKDDVMTHATWLRRAFADDRYIKVNGRPLFVVYRPMDIPSSIRFCELMDDFFEKAREPKPYIVGVDAHCRGTDCRDYGYDATLNFSPQLGVSAEVLNDAPSYRKFYRNLKRGIVSSKLKLYDDHEERAKMANLSIPAGSIPCCFVSWDNSPRRGRNAIIYCNSGPKVFKHWLSRAADAASKTKEKLLFINAWNEWAEGNHLEPDQKYGFAYLEALRDVLSSRPQE